MGLDWGGGAQGAMSGAAAGTAIMPGWGTAIGAGAGGLLGLFSGGNKSGDAYKHAWKKYEPFLNKATDAQNPFYNAGVDATGKYQDWLQGQKDPSGFINHLMSQYGESPWAKFQQQQGERTANNLGSATGLTGSTPLTQFAQQNAHDISGQDMNQWLQHVLGINTQYGNGEADLMHGGEHSADMLSQLYSNAGEYAAGTAYGEKSGKQSDNNSRNASLMEMMRSFGNGRNTGTWGNGNTYGNPNPNAQNNVWDQNNNGQHGWGIS